MWWIEKFSCSSVCTRTPDPFARPVSQSSSRSRNGTSSMIRAS